jgi:hypothetical protein
VKERREIVEETLVASASVARAARRHDVNANQVFYWRKLYREGRLGGGSAQCIVDSFWGRGSNPKFRCVFCYVCRTGGNCRGHWRIRYHGFVRSRDSN